MAYVIAEPCIDVKDTACVAECPVDCIYEGGRMLYIQPDECIDCGACEPVCPVEAIFLDDDVPAPLSEFVRLNAEFFDVSVSGIGSPCGATTDDAVTCDPPTVALWPRRNVPHRGVHLEIV